MERPETRREDGVRCNVGRVRISTIFVIYGTLKFPSYRYDEGTAFMPVVASKRELPKSDKWQFLALDADGYDLPTDWYGHIFPEGPLQLTYLYCVEKVHAYLRVWRRRLARRALHP